ncbi:MAG: DUF6434 domain-containing protein [Myxococcota bacterium]
MATTRRPKLTRKLDPTEFEQYYWLKAELSAFAVAHGIAATGKKLEIAGRIAAFLRTGKAPPGKRSPARGRDSTRRITRATKVEGWVCDAATRAFFERELGPSFHFTVSLNKLGREGKGLTYGDLVEHWRAERQRRKDPKYRPKLGQAGEYNRYVRAFFDDPANAGRSLADAAAGWNRVKAQRGPRRYSKKRGW